MQSLTRLNIENKKLKKYLTGGNFKHKEHPFLREQSSKNIYQFRNMKNQIYL